MRHRPEIPLGPRQLLFPFMLEHIQPMSMEHAVYVCCRMISHQLLCDLSVGSDEWLLAAELGIINAGVLPQNEGDLGWEAAGHLINAALGREVCEV